MIKTCLSLTLSLFILHCPLEAASLNDQANEAWKKRAAPQETQKAIDLWQQSLKENPQQPDVWIRLTEALGRAVRNTSKKAAAKKWAEAAREAGQTAVEQNPTSAPAHAFYAEALGQWANTHKGFSSLKAVKQAVKSLQQAIDLDAKYAYAHMLLAEFYRQAPSGISVGNKEKALAHSRLAAEYEPDRAINRLAYARSLEEHGQRKDAAEQLKAVVQMTPRPDLIPETKANQADAQKMLACMDSADKGQSCAK